MTSRPASSNRNRLTSPPPSRALLELQKQGLELAVSPPSPYLAAPSVRSGRSGRSTPSDLDKPLPLEPFETLKKRSSSIYSTDTTISNILHMYGEHRQLDDIPPLPTLHQPQAYRDTVAPLLIKRLSLSPSPSGRSMKDAPREAASNSSLRPTTECQYPSPSSQTAPSFAEFQRQLQQRRNDLASPMSAASSNLHRQAAYDQLAHPSAKVSSIELSVSVSQTPPLPDAISVTISDMDESDLLPPPPGMSSSSLPSPLYDDWEKPAEFNPALHHDQLQGPLEQCAPDKHWSQNWLDEEFVSQSPDASPLDQPPRRNFSIRETLTEKETNRVLSYAEAKYPNMKRNSSSRKKSITISARSSMQQGVNSLLHSLSRKSAALPNTKAWPAAENEKPLGPPVAITATPYQLYGPDVFSGKHQKQQRKQALKTAEQAQQMQRRRQRTKSVSLASAYASGQSQIVGAMRKLTRKTSQKRKQTLKDSIVHVGSAGNSGAAKPMNRFPDESWV